jgi:hypothetical protein
MFFFLLVAMNSTATCLTLPLKHFKIDAAFNARLLTKKMEFYVHIFVCDALFVTYGHLHDYEIEVGSGFLSIMNKKERNSEEEKMKGR